MPQMEEAAAAAQAFVDRNPRLRVLLGYPHASRGWSADCAGRWREAVDHFSNALEFGDRGNEWIKARGRAYQNLKQWEQARADYERALAIEPDDVESGVILGMLRFRAAGSDAGLAEVTRALEHDPDYAYGFDLRGWMHQSKGRWDEATSDYQRAVDLDPRYALYRFHLAEAQMTLGRTGESRASFETFLAQADPSDPEQAAAIDHARRYLATYFKR